LEKRTRSRFPSPTSLNMEDILIKEGDNIPLETIQKLYDSIPKRIEAILKINGGSISY